MPTSRLGRFSVFGLGGSGSNRFSNGRGIIREDNFYSMGVIGINNLYSINDRTFLKTTISTAADEVIFDEFQAGTSESGITDTIFFDGTYKRTYHRFGTLLNTKIDSRHTLEFGGIYSLLGYNFDERFNPFDTTVAEEPFVFIAENDHSSSLQTYGNWNYRISPNLTFVGGIHFFHFAFNNESLVQPRASLKWNFTPGQSISFGYGEHSRIESLEFYLGNQILEDGSSIQNNRDLRISKARHYVLGYDFQISENLYFKTELYYQELFDVPVVANAEPGNQLGSFSALLDYDEFDIFIDLLDLDNSGTGTNYGIELSLEKRFSNNHYFMINGSIFDARYVGGDGIERNSRFDGRFNVNAIGGKEWKVGKANKNIFGINIRSLYSGNNRIAEINLEASRENGFEIRDFANAFSQTPPNYFRTDLQLSYIKNRLKSTHEWRLDIQNATDRRNIRDDFFNLSTRQVERVFQTNLIPVLSYRIQF